MHGEPLPEEDIPQDESQEDYKFSYHSAKLTFGAVMLEFNDAIKEGDGGRLFELYKLAMLWYKTHGHYKYAYAVLLYLVKCIAILPPSQALRLKWNRSFNGSGLDKTSHLTYGKNMIIRTSRPCGATWVLTLTLTLTNTVQKEQQELWNQGNLFTSLLTVTVIGRNSTSPRTTLRKKRLFTRSSVTC